MIRAMLAAVFVLITLAGPASAGLQRWTVAYLDSSGKPVSYGRHSQAEAWSEDQRGWQVAFGCMDGRVAMHVKAPAGEKPAFGGDVIQPSVRVGKPGTDLFLGPVGDLRFTQDRYSGNIPVEVIEALKARENDKQLTVTEFASRTTILLKVQRIERALGELSCL